MLLFYVARVECEGWQVEIEEGLKELFLSCLCSCEIWIILQRDLFFCSDYPVGAGTICFVFPRLRE